MKIIKIGFLSLIFTLISFASNAQHSTDLQLNEIVSVNTDGLVNEWGIRSGWIEVFNTAYATVDIGGCYITDEKVVKDANGNIISGNIRKYRIPQNDNRTIMGPRQYLLIHADGIESHGLLYTNFRLNPEGGYLALYSADGRTLIEEVEYPAIADRMSYAKNDEGVWGVSSRVTPYMLNIPHEEITQAQKYGASDPSGAVMAITAMAVVFSVLLLLYFCFQMLAKLSLRNTKVKAAAVKGVSVKSEEISQAGQESGEIFAAIALALQMYQDDIHDFEDMVITIEKDNKQFSPWSTKRQLFRETPSITHQPKVTIGKKQTK